MVKKIRMRPSNGLIPVDAVTGKGGRHPTDIPRPPGVLLLPRGSLGINQNSGRQVAAMANAKMPAE